VRVRYRHEGAEARVEKSDAAVRLSFAKPVRAVSRGQVAVFYDGDRVLGGGRLA
jgi:tRNA-specific 2-thiouridylase